MINGKNNPVKIFLVYLIWISFSISYCGKSSDKPQPNPPSNSTFSNPLMQGSDPWVYQKDGVYYYLQTVGNSIRLWKTTAMSKLGTASSTLVYSPIAGTPNSQNIWAPEIHFLDNKWYIYYTAGNGTDASQRLWVLENASLDPSMGTWTDKGRIYNSTADFWAIDATVMEYNNARYFLWSGRPDPTNSDLTQNLYISKMANPWTLEGSVTMISSPDFNWEKVGFGVNEGPETLKNPANQYFLTYSASFCGSDDYALGLLSLKPGGNPLNKTDWEKSSNPVFTKKPQNNAYGPGHNSFFTSIDGKETWMIYHANSSSGQGCGEKRNIRMQRYTFNATGAPNFGEPVAVGLQIAKPSGE